jgi:hypothetical protein
MAQGIFSILADVTIEKTAEITYTEASNQPEPGCLR